MNPETELSDPLLDSSWTRETLLFEEDAETFASAAKKGLLEYHIVSRIQPGSGPSVKVCFSLDQ